MQALIDKHDHEGLKAFSITMMWIFPLIFMVVLPWLFDASIPWWPALLSAILAGLYLIYPPGLYVPYRFWMYIAAALGWLNTRIILALAFYSMIFPIGLLLRLFKKLQYRSTPNNANSNWVKSEGSIDKNNLKDPF